jgi:hypothetical protein
MCGLCDDMAEVNRTWGKYYRRDKMSEVKGEFRCAVVGKNAQSGIFNQVLSWVGKAEGHATYGEAIADAKKAVESNTTYVEVVVLQLVGKASVKRNVTVEDFREAD